MSKVKEFLLGFDRFQVAFIVLVTTVCSLCLTRQADAAVISDLLGLSPLDFIAALLCPLILGFVSDFLVPIVSVAFEWSSDYMTIPYVSTVILMLQAFAGACVVVWRVAVGIKEGVLLSGGSNERSLTDFVMKTGISLLFVAFMPTFCVVVIQLGDDLFHDMLGGGSIGDQLQWFSVGDNFDPIAAGGNYTADLLWLILGVLVIMILTVAVGYQFIRRQVEIVTTSIIAPLVSILSASEYNSDQPWDLLKGLFGLVCIQFLQYLLCQIAIQFGISWMTVAVGAGGDITAYSPDSVKIFMGSIAFFAGALTVPALVDQYTIGGGGSRIGGLVAGSVAAYGARSALRAAGAPVRALHR